MRHPDITTLHYIATEVRRMVTNAARCRGAATCGYWDSTLGGLCGVASDLLVRELRAHGISSTLVFGEFLFSDRRYGGSHCWVECDGYIIDITATQFGEQFPPMWITSVINGNGHRWRRIYWPLAMGGSAYSHITQDTWPTDAKPGALDKWLDKSTTPHVDR